MEEETYTAFNGDWCLVSGPLKKVASEVRRTMEQGKEIFILVFSDSTGKTMDLDWRGPEKEFQRRLQVYLPGEATKAATGPGRPKLGVIAREVSLLPRHWEWLATQPGGASITLRRLVDEAKRSSSKNNYKEAQEKTYRFLSVVAGDLPGYEEALRALYRRNESGFEEQMADWPKDIRAHALRLAKGVFSHGK